MRKLYVSALALALALSGSVFAQKKQQDIPLQFGASYFGKRQDEAMQKFRDNRLGEFIHWGLYSIPGGEWNGKVYGGAADEAVESEKIQCQGMGKDGQADGSQVCEDYN